MDDDDIISRREAVAGLGLLGVLFAGLIGAIGIRIVYARPKPATTSPPTLWASDAAAPSDGSADVAAAPLASEPLPSAAPIPTVADQQSDVPTVSAAAPVEEEAAPIRSEPPRFIAPGSR
jgi:hypothetical protein